MKYSHNSRYLGYSRNSLRSAILDVNLCICPPFGAPIRNGQNLNRDHEKHAAHKAHGINQEALSFLIEAATTSDLLGSFSLPLIPS